MSSNDYVLDPAWPAPVWGVVPARPYQEGALQQRIDLVIELLQGEDFRAA